MARVKSRDTKPELTLRRLVHGLGYRYRTNRRDIIGRPDIAFIGRRSAIFLHGCFWHRHDCGLGLRTPKSRIAFWKGKVRKNVARDAQVLKQLRAAGWRALIVWECELGDPAKVSGRIREFLDAQH
jgi:DNA mismatch endonuclease, patch repair protein